jgi:hypothetical protein
MAGYFSYFAKTLYSLDDNPRDNFQYVTNILQRSKFLREITDNTAAYYPYQIKDNETAEIIADKLYGDSNRHWIVLLFNQILNPFYEFPMSSDVLDSYILDNYGYTSFAATNIVHHYEQIIERSTVLNGIVTDSNIDRYTISEYEMNFSTNAITLRTLPTVGNSLLLSVESTQLDNAGTLFAQSTSSIKAISVFDYEFELNETRREIKLLDAKYVAVVEQEFKKLMSDG